MEQAENRMTTSRWIAAGAAACAVALLTVPWMLRSARLAPPQAAPSTTTASSTERGPANLNLTVKDMNGASVRLADY
jgi:hypothetical protein